MSEARKILNMIETVSPDDTGRLNEIDARVYCWWQGNIEYVSHRTSDIFGAILKCRQIKESIEYPAGQEHIESNVPQFTRSRDALKSVRPQGWLFSIHPNAYDDCKPHATLEIRKELRPKFPKIFSRHPEFLEWEIDATCQTEELAELHVIIQAIEYERENGYTTTI